MIVLYFVCIYSSKPSGHHSSQFWFKVLLNLNTLFMHPCNVKKLEEKNWSTAVFFRAAAFGWTKGPLGSDSGKRSGRDWMLKNILIVG